METISQNWHDGYYKTTLSCQQGYEKQGEGGEDDQWFWLAQIPSLVPQHIIGWRMSYTVKFDIRHILWFG